MFKAFHPGVVLLFFVLRCCFCLYESVQLTLFQEFCSFQELANLSIHPILCDSSQHNEGNTDFKFLTSKLWFYAFYFSPRFTVFRVESRLAIIIYD